MAVGTNATTLSSLDTQGILPKPLVGEIIKKAVSYTHLTLPTTPYV